MDDWCLARLPRSGGHASARPKAGAFRAHPVGRSEPGIPA